MNTCITYKHISLYIRHTSIYYMFLMFKHVNASSIARFFSKNIGLSIQTNSSKIYQQCISLNVELVVEKSKKENILGVSSLPLGVQSRWIYIYIYIIYITHYICNIHMRLTWRWQASFELRDGFQQCSPYHGEYVLLLLCELLHSFVLHFIRR